MKNLLQSITFGSSCYYVEGKKNDITTSYKSNFILLHISSDMYICIYTFVVNKKSLQLYFTLIIYYIVKIKV